MSYLTRAGVEEMPDSTSKDDEIRKKLSEVVRYNSFNLSNIEATDELMRIVKQYGIQERIDELSHLGFDKRLDNPILSCYDESDFGAITLDERLTALKDKEIE